MNRNVRCVVALLLLGALGSCAQQPASRGVQLAGTTWQLDALGDRAAIAPRPMLRFGLNGAISGQASCNRYSATARIDDRTMTVGPIATTRMACSEAVDAQETAYLGRLGKATRFEVDGTVLKIYSADESLPLQFLRTPDG